MRAASSTAATGVGACGLGAAGEATAGRGWLLSQMQSGSGVARQRPGRRRLGAVHGEPRGVGLTGREAVEARVVEAQYGDAQLGAPEVLAPAAVAVTQAVGADEVRDGLGGMAALGEYLDRAEHLRETRL